MKRDGRHFEKRGAYGRDGPCRNGCAKGDNTHSEGRHGRCILESRSSLALLRPNGVSHALRGALKHGRRVSRIAEPCASSSRWLSEICIHETRGREKRLTAYERGAKKLGRRSFVAIGVLLERLLNKGRPLRRGEAPANEDAVRLNDRVRGSQCCDTCALTLSCRPN